MDVQKVGCARPLIVRCLLYTNPYLGICDVCQSALGGLFPSGTFLPPR